MAEKYQTIRLTPLTRLTKSFDLELNLDKQGLFNKEVYDNFINMHHESVVRLNKLIRSLMYLNALLFLLQSGSELIVPGFGIELSKIPAIAEIIISLTTVTFLFVCLAFVNEQSYAGLVDQIGNRLSSNQYMDPDFINASKKFYEFTLKVFRPKLNLWGLDFYESTGCFKFVCYSVFMLIFIIVLALPLLHIFLVYTSMFSLVSRENVFFFYLFFTFITFVNLTSFAIVVVMMISFEFKQVAIESVEDITRKSVN